ncbi:hypothetical protein D3C72_1448820 [compost metagenome]
MRAADGFFHQCAVQPAAAHVFLHVARGFGGIVLQQGGGGQVRVHQLLHGVGVFGDQLFTHQKDGARLLGEQLRPAGDHAGFRHARQHGGDGGLQDGRAVDGAGQERLLDLGFALVDQFDAGRVGLDLVAQPVLQRGFGHGALRIAGQHGLAAVVLGETGKRRGGVAGGEVGGQGAKRHHIDLFDDVRGDDLDVRALGAGNQRRPDADIGGVQLAGDQRLGQCRAALELHQLRRRRALGLQGAFFQADEQLGIGQDGQIADFQRRRRGQGGGGCGGGKQGDGQKRAEHGESCESRLDAAGALPTGKGISGVRLIILNMFIPVLYSLWLYV